MSLIDIIILTTTIIVLSLLIYFNFIKTKGSPCQGCALRKECSLKDVESLKQYYRTQCDNYEAENTQE